MQRLRGFEELHRSHSNGIMVEFGMYIMVEIDPQGLKTTFNASDLIYLYVFEFDIPKRGGLMEVLPLMGLWSESYVGRSPVASASG